VQERNPLWNKGFNNGSPDYRNPGIRNFGSWEAAITVPDMTPPPGTYAIGPSTGAIKLYTTRAGVAAKVGHDLTITFANWSGQIVLADDDGRSAHLTVEIDVTSFQILEGTGGAVALGPDDRKDITSTALRLLEADREPRATYTSTAVRPSGDGATIDGDLVLRGQSAPVPLTITATGPSSWRASATLLQSTFGIKPYKAFFGALRLADEVRIESDIDLSATSPA